MATRFNQQLSIRALWYMIHHVFLPPKLPQKDDFHFEDESTLLMMVITSLTEFQKSVSSNDFGVVQSVLSAMHNMAYVRDGCTHDSGVNEEILRRVMMRACDDRTIVPIHIRAQNAGIHLSRANDSVVWELFELSPLNEAVMTCKGRLRRRFPGPAWSLGIQDYQQAGMIDTLAETLAKMAHQSAPDTRPKVKKARQMHEEIRDTVHPKLVTELFGSILRSVGQEATISRIWKNTREDVLWSQSLLPWRRSPCWLLIRVTMQLVFTRHKAQSSSKVDLYKEAMVFLMAQILEEACSRALPADLIYVMNAKVARRTLKLDLETGSCNQYVQRTVQKASSLVEARWFEIRSASTRACEVSQATFNIDHDTAFDVMALDQYLADRGTWTHERSVAPFKPPQVTISFPAIQLPELSHSIDDNDVYSLMALEVWVASHLDSWLCKHQGDTSTCGNLAKLVKDYYKIAQHLYDGNPEAFSKMILTVLELWVACDRSATTVCTLLQDYDPGIPFEWVECLLLPSSTSMERLVRIESYLQTRQARARHRDGLLFREFGTSACFAVKYFESSIAHQTLLARIEEDAACARREKEAEFDRKKARYSSLMSSYDSANCEFYEVEDLDNDLNDWRHRPGCGRCRYRAEAAALSIQIYEWPLPEARLEAMSAVFELVVPESFGHWRDACIFVVYDVFQSRYRRDEQPRSFHPIKTFSGLRKYFVPFSDDQRIGLLSEVKPHGVTHRDGKKIAHSSLHDVCLQNGLRYRYFDSQLNTFTETLECTSGIASCCTYRLSSRSAALQTFLARPPTCPSGPTPNAVVAGQFDCPEHLSLNEYYHLVSIPLGFRLLWLNILLQLSMPSIDLSKDETGYVVLQSVHQTGPALADETLRAAHSRLNDTIFANVLLQRLHEHLGRIRENWESSQTLAILVSLALRLASLASDKGVRDDCFLFLSQARAVAAAWTRALGDRAALLMEDVHRGRVLAKSVECALIWIDTYHVDTVLLEKVLLEEDGTASAFIEACIYIQQNQFTLDEHCSHLIVRLRWRWQSLCQRSCPILRHAIVDGGSNMLDVAISRSWSAYQPTRLWQSHPQRMSHWLTQQMGPSTVQYNLLTGELLMNGLPLSRLPSRYESLKMYDTLFKRMVLEVMPSQMPGMQFSAKKPHCDHRIDLGIDAAQKTLRVHATCGVYEYVLIPKDALGGHFPIALVDDFVHWYNVTNDYVEFRPAETPWSSQSTRWWLTRYNSRWRLTANDSVLLSIQSKTVRLIASVLSCLDHVGRMLVSFDQGSDAIEIDIPRLELGFYIDSDRRSIKSRQFRGMFIDLEQQSGTLVGLRDQLVLKHTKTGQRLVIVPEGKVVYEKKADHIQVTIEKDSMTKFHAYRVEPLLGRLKDNDTLQSKLYLAYLHALTSFCLPDPLTHQTGTEQALRILSSAAVLSHDTLTEENVNLLEKIAGLTPNRQYYPKNERVMQEVQWDENLSFFSQHGHFHLRKRLILENVQQASMFFPARVSRTRETQDNDLALWTRENIRTSSFRVAGSGAEDHTDEEDVTYSSRDQGQSSRATNAFILASIIYQQRFEPHFPLKNVTEQYLWRFLCGVGQVFGPHHVLPSMGIRYDATYLMDSTRTLAQHWCCLHEKLNCTSPVTRISQMFWIATMAFASDSDPLILQVLASAMVNPRQGQFSPPPVATFQLGKGTEPSEAELRKLIRTAALPFRSCPEANLVRLPHESSQKHAARQNRQYQSSQDRAMNTCLEVLKRQWPCQSPVSPSDWRCPSHLDLTAAMKAVKPLYETCYHNHLLRQCVGRAITTLHKRTVVPIVLHSMSPRTDSHNAPRKRGYITTGDMLSSVNVPVPVRMQEAPSMDVLQVDDDAEETNLRLPGLIRQIEAGASIQYERDYVADLRASLQRLQSHSQQRSIVVTDDSLTSFERHVRLCQRHVDTLYNSMKHAVTANMAMVTAATAVTEAALSPRVSPRFFLQQLSREFWPTTAPAWRSSIVEYGIAVTKLQQADRMLGLRDNLTDLATELSNPGHTNWDAMVYPESLLLEIESGVMIRSNQEQVAKEMREPRVGHNAVMQLNMGEGKSSIIVPIVVAAMADGTRLVRVIVTKPQSRQMFRMLVSKLGGLLGRRVYRMPFSRDLRLDQPEVDRVAQICRECIECGGVLLMQPEHILSFKLMGIDSLISGKEAIGRSLLAVQRDFDERSRDIIDESDEVFSVRFELIYTMGLQQPLEMSPTRWLCIQRVLDLVNTYLPDIQSRFPDAIHVGRHEPGTFTRVRILHLDAWRHMVHLVVKHICDIGLAGIPVARQKKAVRESIFKYIVKYDVDTSDRTTVENPDVCGLWTGSFRPAILLLRGLFAGGVLLLTLGQKRWRVDYGQAFVRSPPTRLAVPYTAKDCPTARSEFSHPDVTIVLTSLNYYYAGIQDEDMSMAFNHLMKSDQADLEFQAWVGDCPDLPISFRQLCGINLKDQTQCVQAVFPFLRRSKKVIDYFLSHIVFPKEMRTFPAKLSVSGWDVGQARTRPTTGFSGTNDSRKLLPLDVEYMDLPEQRHTNALVLERLLHPANSVTSIPASIDLSETGANVLLSVVVGLEPAVRVILDVGAQVIELDNLTLARRWLEMIPDPVQTKAAIFFNDDDELCVVDRRGTIEHLPASVFAEQLDLCLIFLDEAHTRGTDLKLPRHYRAAVTIGPQMTKDKLVQGKHP